MRVCYLFFLCFAFLHGCSEKKGECSCTLFDENEYELKITKLDDFNQKLSELYQNKNDPSKKLMKLFWANGHLQSTIFLTNNTKSGPFVSYDTIGNLSYSGFFLNNKETGVSCYYDNSGKIKKIIINKDGKKIGEVDTVVFRR